MLSEVLAPPPSPLVFKPLLAPLKASLQSATHPFRLAKYPASGLLKASYSGAATTAKQASDRRSYLLLTAAYIYTPRRLRPHFSEELREHLQVLFVTNCFQACEELLLLVLLYLHTLVVFWESGKAATTVSGRSAFLRASRAASCEVSGLRLVGTTAPAAALLSFYRYLALVLVWHDMRVYDT